MPLRSNRYKIRWFCSWYELLEHRKFHKIRKTIFSWMIGELWDSLSWILKYSAEQTCPAQLAADMLACTSGTETSCGLLFVVLYLYASWNLSFHFFLFQRSSSNRSWIERRQSSCFSLHSAQKLLEDVNFSLKKLQKCSVSDCFSDITRVAPGSATEHSHESLVLQIFGRF